MANTDKVTTMSTHKIARTISAVESRKKPTKVDMHEGVGRPNSLVGRTYKIRTPTHDHAMYITINDIILNEGTAFEERRPFEIFINSKNMSSFAWITALTRIISAVFRKGGEFTFLIDELRSIFDPKGGYFKIGGQGKFMNSIIAEIGDVLEEHLIELGMINPPAKIEAVTEDEVVPVVAEPQGERCPKCNAPSLVRQEGCAKCISCGYSKCG